MNLDPQTELAQILASPSHGDPQQLADAWYDQTLTLRLLGAGSTATSIAGHLRRSFLGALGSGASAAAKERRPCTWDPPCALDVFRREQLRGPKGDGLPKPFVIRTWAHDEDLVILLRVFGMATDWFIAAAEAMVAGIREILPWSKLRPEFAGVPEITERRLDETRIKRTVVPQSVVLDFASPMDATGADLTKQPHSLVTRLTRRVDALSRWNGIALHPEVGRALSTHAKHLAIDTTGLRSGSYDSPNQHGQRRRDPTWIGNVAISGDLAPVWPIIQAGARCHIGRHAVEGLGAFEIYPSS